MRRGASAFSVVRFVFWFVFSPWPGHPSLRNVEESLHHVDATFFLGKVGFLATGGKCVPRLLLPSPHREQCVAGCCSGLLAKAAWLLERTWALESDLLSVFLKANLSRSFC